MNIEETVCVQSNIWMRIEIVFQMNISLRQGKKEERKQK